MPDHPMSRPRTDLTNGLRVASPDIDDDADLGAWVDCFSTVFASPRSTAEFRESRREVYRAQRLTGVRDDGGWVASFRSWRTSLSVPGPAAVPCELVSTVAVAPTHRRRGLLTGLMHESLRHAAADGAALASLIASEAPIYGRYGFGAAVEAVELAVDAARAREWLPSAPTAPGRVRLCDDDELLAAGPAVYEAARALVPGAPPRLANQWEGFLDRVPHPQAKPDAARVVAVHEAPDGTVDGYLRLRMEERWADRSPAFTARVEDLAAADPAVVASLWRFCVDLDLVRLIEAGDRPVGEVLPELLADRRAARETARYDMFWLRVLDLPAALGARRWSAPVDVVLDVHDPLGLTAGRWRLRAGGDETGGDETGADVRPTQDAADVALDVADLAPLVTGGIDLLPLAAAGRLREATAGAVARLSAASRVGSMATMTFTGF